MGMLEDWRRAIPEANARWEAMWRDLASEGVVRQPLWPRREMIPLWDGAIGQPEPAIGVLPLRRECRDIVLVIAGGAFLFKSAHEALPVARAFYGAGFNAAILDYRCRPCPNAAMRADGMRAVRFLRHCAKNAGIERARIVAGGFSAGGLLISLMNQRIEENINQKNDEIDAESPIPDAEFMIYGAFTDAAVVEEPKPATRLCGFDMRAARLRAGDDLTLRLPDALPPAFIMQTDDDDPLFLLDMARAWRLRGIPCEAHLFHGGCHGGGLYDGKYGAADDPHAAHWFALCREWLTRL